MNRALIASVIVLAGCSSSPVRQSYANGKAAADTLCGCATALGYPNESQCLATEYPTTDATIDCLDQEYAANPTAADPTITCQRDATSAFLSCLNAVSGCDTSMLRACKDEYQSALRECPDLPDSVTMRFANCLDRDGDGVSDATDQCPGIPEDVDGDADTDGCPEGLTYSFCAMDSDCSATDGCYAVIVGPASTNGQFCSHTCTADSDCPSSPGFTGGCYNIESTTELCYQRCDFDSDCPRSSVCIQITLTTGGTDFVCVPNG